MARRSYPHHFSREAALDRSEALFPDRNPVGHLLAPHVSLNGVSFRRLDLSDAISQRLTEIHVAPFRIEFLERRDEREFPDRPGLMVTWKPNDEWIVLGFLPATLAEALEHADVPIASVTMAPCHLSYTKFAVNLGSRFRPSSWRGIADNPPAGPLPGGVAPHRQLPWDVALHLADRVADQMGQRLGIPGAARIIVYQGLRPIITERTHYTRIYESSRTYESSDPLRDLLA